MSEFDYKNNSGDENSNYAYSTDKRKNDQKKPNKKKLKRWQRTLTTIIADILLIGIGLVIFSYFHHVRPQKGGQGEIITPDKSHTQTSDALALVYEVTDNNGTVTVSIDISSKVNLKSAVVDINYNKDSYESVSYTHLDVYKRQSHNIEYAVPLFYQFSYQTAAFYIFKTYH